jgi:hypothetical protein
MKIEPFKYMIQPVAIERDDAGQVRREIPGEVLNVYSLAQAMEAITAFEQQLKQMTEGSDNGSSSNNNDGSDVRQPELSGQ